MSKRIVIYIMIMLTAALLFNACKPKETIARLPKHAKEFIKMDLNGNSWEANLPKNGTLSSNHTDREKISISGDIYAVQNDTLLYAKNGFSILFIEKKKGKQSIQSSTIQQMVNNLNSFSDTTPVTASFGTMHQQGEMICEQFIVDTTSNNWIEIIQEEENYKYIWGRFNFTVYKVRNCTAGGFPDTLRITNGEFYFEF